MRWKVSQPFSDSVGLVADAVIVGSPPSAKIGPAVSDSPEKAGPTTPMTVSSPIACVARPVAWLGSPAESYSSRSTWQSAFSSLNWSTASSTPLRMLMPRLAAAPVRAPKKPIATSSQVPASPPPLAASSSSPPEVPQAVSASARASRGAPVLTEKRTCPPEPDRRTAVRPRRWSFCRPGGSGWQTVGRSPGHVERPRTIRDRLVIAPWTGRWTAADRGTADRADRPSLRRQTGREPTIARCEAGRVALPTAGRTSGLAGLRRRVGGQDPLARAPSSTSARSSRCAAASGTRRPRSCRARPSAGPWPSRPPGGPPAAPRACAPPRPARPSPRTGRAPPRSPARGRSSRTASPGRPWRRRRARARPAPAG